MAAGIHFLLVAIGAIFLVPTSYAADPSASLPPDIVKAALDWSTCRSTKVLNFIETSRTAESIVDEALQECMVFERETVRAWLANYGANSEGQVLALRERWRQGLVAQVNAKRTGAPTADPTGAWGVCVGNHIPKPLPPGVGSEAIADSALEACLPEQEKIRTATAQKYGSNRASSDIEELRSQMRLRAISLIETERKPQ